MDIFFNINTLISEHIMEPLASFIDNLNYELAVFWGFDYMPEYTVFFTLLAELAITALIFYISGYIVYLAIITIFRKVFKL